MKIGNLTLFEKRVIGPECDPLLIRYIIFRVPAIGFYLHNMKRSDYDRALHDHPWAFVSVVLKGGYRECHDQTLTGEQDWLYHVPRSVLVRPAQWRHRFVLNRNEENTAFIESWTLVIVGRRTKRWGFFTSGGWCWWRKYNSDLNICEDEPIWTGGKD